MRPAAAVGLALAVAHAAALPSLLDACRRPPLVVTLRAEAIAPRFGIEAELPADMSPTPIVDIDGVSVPTEAGPGLHAQRWTVRYGGGVIRQVTAAQLAGPFQDPSAPPCTARVAIGQALLDDGAASPGTIAAVVRTQIERTMRGVSAFGVGDFTAVKSLGLRWAQAAAHPDDAALLGGADGYVRATAVLAFERVDVPLTLALIPTLDAGRPSFAIRARAALDFDNRVLQWLSDKLGGDRLATRLARDQIDALVLSALEPPPPVPLPGGRSLTFVYCGAPVQIGDGAFGALPIGVAITGGGDAGRVLPPRRGAVALPAPSATSAVTLDVEFDGLDAILHELWRTGLLDEQLAALGLDRQFNESPEVGALLSIRLSPLRLALPPGLGVHAGRVRLAAELRLAVGDGAASTPARLWGMVGLALPGTSDAVAPPLVSLDRFDLTCEPRPGRLEPCFADLVEVLRARGPETHGVLTRTFTDLLDRLFVGAELGSPQVPATLRLERATPRAIIDGAGGAIRLELAGRVEPTS